MEATNSYANIEQTWGYYLIARILQESDSNWASINQNSLFNSAYIYQGGDGGHSAQISQSGTGGLAAVAQYGSYSYANIEQRADQNMSSVLQSAAYDVTSIVQDYGSNNSSAYVIQDGDYNVASITQAGQYDYVYAHQSVNGTPFSSNSLIVNQYGNNDSITIAQSGQPQAITINQYGNNAHMNLSRN